MPKESVTSSLPKNGNLTEELGKIYYDPNHWAGFSSVEKLKKASGKSRKDVLAWLQSQRTYTLHKQNRIRGYSNSKTYVGGIDDSWQCDLMCLEKLGKFNDGTRFVLVCIDVFSKFVFCEPLKNKTGLEVKNALEKILKDRKPFSMCTDDGKEFFNRDVSALLKKNEIQHFSNKVGMKSAVVERVIRTLKNKISRYQTYKNTFRYVDVLPQIVHSYNHSHHRTIKMRPVDVTKQNEKEIWQRLFLPFPKKQKFKFNVDDTVRISRRKGMFDKGYKHNWSEEHFVVAKCLNRDPPMYKIKDLNGETLEGAFYQEELQAIVVPKDQIYQIEKIVGRKKVGNKRYVKVKWLGWNDTFNSWIAEDSLQ